jgi:carbamoyl-phosphate synthase large subunit
MNVLLTCAGRRTSVVAAFQNALGGEGLVLACDTNLEAPALQQADRAFLVPPVDRESYIDALLGICARQQVAVVIPTLEPELPLLAEHRARFTAIGTLPLISSSDVITRCHDKLETARFLKSCGLGSPRSFTSLGEVREALARREISFPLVIKPRWGVSSINTQVVGDDEELELAFRLSRKQLPRTILAGVSATDWERALLVQEKLPGDEYGMDVVNDLEGRYVATLARRKLRMRGGQTDRAVSVVDQRLETLGRTLGEKLGHVGLLDCDVFVSGDGACVIDLNPRIGGGYPFSHAAGADFPSALLAWVKGKKADPRWLRVEPGVTAARGELLLVKPRPPRQPHDERNDSEHRATPASAGPP